MPTSTVTVDLPDETVDALRSIASARGTNMAEALKQVIETQHFLQGETQKGYNLLIQNPADKSLRKMTFKQR